MKANWTSEQNIYVANVTYPLNKDFEWTVDPQGNVRVRGVNNGGWREYWLPHRQGYSMQWRALAEWCFRNKIIVWKKSSGSFLCLISTSDPMSFADVNTTDEYETDTDAMIAAVLNHFKGVM